MLSEWRCSWTARSVSSLFCGHKESDAPGCRTKVRKNKVSCSLGSTSSNMHMCACKWLIHLCIGKGWDCTWGPTLTPIASDGYRMNISVSPFIFPKLDERHCISVFHGEKCWQNMAFHWGSLLVNTQKIATEMKEKGSNIIAFAGSESRKLDTWKNLGQFCAYYISPPPPAFWQTFPSIMWYRKTGLFYYNTKKTGFLLLLTASLDPGYRHTQVSTNKTQGFSFTLYLKKEKLHTVSSSWPKRKFHQTSKTILGGTGGCNPEIEERLFTKLENLF